MSVKTIFKALIGTIFVIIVSSVIIEFYNVSVISMQLKQVSKMAAKQACVLFTQETYKEMKNGSTTGGTIKMSNIQSEDGSLYISGDFYIKDNPQEIWKSIYGNTKFKSFCELTPVDSSKKMYELFPDLKTMLNAYKLTNGEAVTGDDKARAIMFKNNMYTTSNIGVPYLDEDIVTRMYQWNLAKLLAGEYKSSIQKDAAGANCVNYRGFRCYADRAKLNYTYHVYNLGNTSEHTNFFNATGLKVKKQGDSGRGITIKTDGTNPNYYVTVVEIEYSMPVSYQGITPLRNIFDYIWRTEVQGMSDTAPTQKTGESPNPFSTSTLKSGGLSGTDTGELSSTGKLIYTLVR